MKPNKAISKPYYGGANFALAQAMVEKRRSNAAGKHADKRTKRAKTRGAKKARVMKEWL